ncbi:MAG: PEP-CTERM sorting domain-containing protein [Phycisphaerales bacterium]|nr:MAG: PEP-CTERM sorting domain-containing protein [Phycisphaerales bacterium]
MSAAAAACVSAGASAAFVGLSVENSTGLFTGGNHFGPNQANVTAAWNTFTQNANYTVYRLYADFDTAGDQLFNIGIVPGMTPPLEIQVSHANPPVTGPVVYNDPDNGVLAPTEAALADPVTARRAFDSFATIGMDVDNGANQTAWGPVFGNIHGLFDVNSGVGVYSADQDTWGVGVNDPQSFAVPGGSAGYRVLIAQFTVADGTVLAGQLSGQWGAGTFVAGEPEIFTFTASFFVPAPGSVALLALAGLTVARRRR